MECRSLLLSVSGSLAEDLIDWRNNAVEHNATCGQIICGLGLTSLALLAIIETVVRAVLCVPALPFMYFLPESQKEIKYTLVAALVWGTFGSMATVASYFNAMVSNICDDSIDVVKVMPDCIRAGIDHLRFTYPEVFAHFKSL